MEQSKKSISFYAKGFVLIAIFLFLWEIVVRLSLIDELVLPKPSLIFLRGLYLITSFPFFTNVSNTLFRWSIAFIIGITIGLALGFGSGVNKMIEQVVLPISAFIRSIPPIALFPVFLIVLGPGGLPIIAVGIIGVAIYVFPIANQASQTAQERFSELALILELSSSDFIKRVIFPATLISTIVAARIAASYLFALTIAGEIINGINKGIGSAIFEASEKYKLEEAYFYIFISGLLGLVIDILFSSIQGKYSYKE